MKNWLSQLRLSYREWEPEIIRLSIAGAMCLLCVAFQAIPQAIFLASVFIIMLAYYIWGREYKQIGERIQQERAEGRREERLRRKSGESGGKRVCDSDAKKVELSGWFRWFAREKSSERDSRPESEQIMESEGVEEPGVDRGVTSLEKLTARMKVAESDEEKERIAAELDAEKVRLKEERDSAADLSSSEGS